MTEEIEINSYEGIDKKLFEFLLDTDPEVLKRLSPSVSKEEEERFLNSDFSINPIITYPNLHSGEEELNKKKETLLNTSPFLIQAYIDSRGLSTNERERLLTYYQDFVKRRSDIFDMISASRIGNFQKFDSITKELYGEPSILIFNTYLKKLKEKIDNSEDNPELSLLVNNVKDVISFNYGEVLDEGDIDLEPFRKFLLSYMQTNIEKLSNYQDRDILDSHVIKNMFEVSLDSIHAKGWKVILSEEYKSITVKGDKETVYIPKEHSIEKKRLVGLLAHDIFTHVLRRENSKEIFPYEILRSGLNGYLESEEAIATFSEAAFNSDIDLDIDGGDMHFATCLALGLDGKKRDFKEVFKILYHVKKFIKVREGKDLVKAEKDAKKSAWKTSLRIFRGTPGDIAGICFRKDLVYGEGRLKLFKYLEEKNVGDISELWSAKYSPWEPSHTQVLKNYTK